MVQEVLVKLSKTKIDVSTVEAAENTEEVVVLSPEGNGDERQQEQPEEGEIQVRITAVLRIRDVYPGSRIQKRHEERGEKNFSHTFSCSHKFHKIEKCFSFEALKKTIWAIFQRITV